jgi:hypothetical protein
LFFGYALFSTRSVALFLALFFQPSSVFNNFSASFFGLLSFVFEVRSFVINNLSALFFKKGILLFFFGPQNRREETPIATKTFVHERCGFCLPQT